MPEFSNLSLARLGTCHAELQRLFFEVIKRSDCVIICGYRNEKDQTSAYVQGFSKLQWPHSKHNALPSLAADVMPSPLEWDNAERTKEFSELVKSVAKELGITIRYGGDFSRLSDRDHFELSMDSTT